MDKQSILTEIRRTAEANDGIPLSHQAFSRVTGIAKEVWLGRYWSRWNEALADAGYIAEEAQPNFDDSYLIEQLIVLSRELGRPPLSWEIRLRATQDESFPSPAAIKRLGSKRERALRIVAYCNAHEGFADVLDAYQLLATEPEIIVSAGTRLSQESADEYVCLVKTGKNYTVVGTSAEGRRALQQCSEVDGDSQIIHSIKTDDSAGIAVYWLKRFEPFKIGAENFNLGPAEIKSFKRRKFM